MDRNFEINETLNDEFAFLWTYHSNNIEGNNLSYDAVLKFLEKGTTVEDARFKDYLEIKNHLEVINSLKDIRHNAIKLSEHTITSLHELLLKGIDDKYLTPGEYRKNNIRIIGAKIIPADSYVIKSKLEKLINWYNDNQDIDIIEKIARFHYKFEKIHPFNDGNGRIGRILMNLQLMKNEYPPVLITNEEKDEYYKLLENAALNKEYNQLTEWLRDKVNKRIEELKIR